MNQNKNKAAQALARLSHAAQVKRLGEDGYKARLKAASAKGVAAKKEKASVKVSNPESAS